MTEVPEHLLRRSQQRRAAMGGGGGAEGGGDAPSTAVEPAAAARPAASGGAVTAAASAAPAVEESVPTGGFTGPPPKPPRRDRVPLWAMPVLAMLPLWAIGYAGAFGERGSTAPIDPVLVGQTVYSSCSTCHGAGGAGGGSIPGLTEVEVTFPNFDDHVSWIKTGSRPFTGQPYGALGRIATGGMQGFEGSLSEEQIIAVACYERVRFGGQDISELPQCTEDAAIGRGAGGGGAAASGSH